VEEEVVEEGGGAATPVEEEAGEEAEAGVGLTTLAAALVARNRITPKL